MKMPGSDHPIAITRNARRVRVHFAGRVIADTCRALTLKEAHYPPVQYIPREDVDVSAFTRTTRHTHCPYKGEASYFHLHTEDGMIENAVWSYETPLEQAQQIKGYLAFYASRVDRIDQTS